MVKRDAVRKMRCIHTGLMAIRLKLLTQTDFCRVPERGSGRYWA